MWGEGRVAGVVQPLHQIVSRQKFVEDDQDTTFVDDGEEWGGIESAEAAPEVIDNDLEGDEASSDNDSADSAADAKAAVVAEGADDLAWEDLIGDTSAVVSSPASAKGKKRQVENDDEESEDDGRRKKQVKEPRMKTNKKQAENFFTHANVKNKNRNRKIPANPDGRKRRK